MSDLKKESFGRCKIAEVRPLLSNPPKAINILLSFEETLKLNLALSECLRKINKYKRNTKAGKSAATSMVIRLATSSIDVIEGGIRMSSK